MKHDENENNFSLEEIGRAIYISDLPANFQIKHLIILFSKAGDIENIYQRQNSIIMIFFRQSSAEMALIYHNFKLGVTDNEIKVKLLKDLEITYVGNSWKEIKDFPKKDSKSPGIKLIEPSSIRSSLTSQVSFNESFEHSHAKAAKRISGLMKEEEIKEGNIFTKYEEKSKINLSIIKEGPLLSEKASPISSLRPHFSFLKNSNKENEFSLKLNKIQISDENLLWKKPEFEKLNYQDFPTLSFIDSALLSKKKFDNIQEEHYSPNLFIDSKKYQINPENNEVFAESLKEEESQKHYSEMDEPVEQIFQPLKNFKTSIGKFYKHHDIVRDYLLTKGYFMKILKLWIAYYILHHIYQYFQ